MESELLRQTDYMSIFHTLRAEVDKLNDVKKLTQVGSTRLALAVAVASDET